MSTTDEQESNAELAARWALWMRASGRADTTIKHRLEVLDLFERRTNADALVCDWPELAQFLGTAPSSGTRWNYHQALDSWFRWLIRMGLRADNPLDQLDRPKRGRSTVHAYEDDTLARVLSTGMYRRTRMMIMLGALQGMRALEVAHMRGELIEGDWLTITGKGGHTRVVPVHPLIAEMAGQFPATGWWFPSPKDPSRPIMPNSVSSIVGKAIRRAGVKGGSHRLRHWYGTTNLHNGGNLREVQELLGHADPNTTKVYTQVKQERLRLLVNRLELPEHEPVSRSRPAGAEATEPPRPAKKRPAPKRDRVVVPFAPAGQAPTRARSTALDRARQLANAERLRALGMLSDADYTDFRQRLTST